MTEQQTSSLPKCSPPTIYIMGLFSNNIQYAGGFIEQEDGPVMIAMLDGTGMNALYFHLYMGE